LTIRDMPILKVLGLSSKHPTKLIVLLLNKATKSGVLRCNIGSKRHLFLSSGPNGGLKVSIISGE